MKPSIEDLAKFIEKKISYDGSQDAPEIKCCHCGKNAREQVMCYWIDHQASLAGEIQQHLGLKTHAIYDILENEIVTGNRHFDSMQLAERIIEEVFL